MSMDSADTLTERKLRFLSEALRGRGVSVLHQTVDRRFDLAEALPPVWPDPIGLVEEDALPPQVATVFALANKMCASTRQEQNLVFELSDESGRHQFVARMLPETDGVTTILTDVTEERSREAALASLLREVSHRSKNLLAIVQSIAMQTARHSEDIEDFLTKFRGRLHALASTQDLVTESNWRGIHLHALVASQLTRIGHSALTSMRISGENPQLGPNASLHIGLAIHELAANAVLHGGLAKGKSGKIRVDAKFTDASDHPPDLALTWQEAGIDPHQVRRPPRFGSLVLERIVPLSVGGSAEFNIGSDTVTYRLIIPADQFET